MTSRLRLLAPLLAALALVAGCGASDENSPDRASASTDANELLRTTFANLDQIKSATVDLKVQADAGGAAASEGTVKAHLQGPFERQGAGKVPKFAFTATVESGGQNITAGATWTGEKAYVSLLGTAYEVPGPIADQVVAGYEQALKSSGGSGGLGIDVTPWLKDARNEGEATVGDTDVIKITGTADVRRVVDDLSTLTQKAGALNVPGAAGKLPKQLTPQEKQQAVDAIKSLTVTVYTGAEDQLLRRLTVTADVADAASDLNAKLLLDLTLTKVNEDQSFPAPENAKPFDELLKAVDGFGLGGGFFGGSVDSEDSSAPKAETELDTELNVDPDAMNNVDKFADCIEDAGSDSAKARKCAELLTG